MKDRENDEQIYLFLLVNPLLEKCPDDVSNTTIDFSHQKLLDRDLTNVIEQISNKRYSILQLQCHSTTSQGLSLLVDALVSRSTTTEYLWLGNNCISDLGVQTLACIFLFNNTTLKQLHLGSSYITNQGVRCLVDMLKSN